MATWGAYFQSQSDLQAIDPGRLPDRVILYAEGVGWVQWLSDSLEESSDYFRPSSFSSSDAGRYKILQPQFISWHNIATTNYVQTQISNLDDDIHALGNLATTGAIERTGEGSLNTFSVSSFSKGVISQTDANAWRTELGLGSAALQAETYFLNASVVSTFGGSLIDDNDASEARTTLQLGSAAVEDISTFGVSLIGSTDAAAGRSNLGLGSAAVEDISTFGVSLIGSTDAAAGRSNLGLGSAAVEDTSAFASASHDHVADFPSGFLYKDSSSNLVGSPPTQLISSYPGTAPTSLEAESNTTSIFMTDDPTTMGGSSSADFAGSYIFIPSNDGSAWVIASGYSKDSTDPDYTPYQDGIVHANVSNGTLFVSAGGGWTQVSSGGTAGLQIFTNAFPDNTWGVDADYGTSGTPGSGYIPEDGEQAICLFDSPSALGGGSSTDGYFYTELHLYAYDSYWRIQSGKGYDQNYGPPDIYTPPEAGIIHVNQSTQEQFVSLRDSDTNVVWAKQNVTIV